ncbi:MAG: 3-isopropylmalate dehydratase small subunit [Anaerolineales bacterium]
MNTYTTISSVCIPMKQKNIDTDQIIPSRYLKAIDKASVSEGLFADWRYNADGTLTKEFIFNQPEYKKAQILLAGDNFGCGSSREHAPWAILGWGIKAVISTSFADIFKNNALKNSLLPITVNEEIHQSLFNLVEKSAGAEITIDLEAQSVTLPDGESFIFDIDPFVKKCMLTGVDQLGYILSLEDQISHYEQDHENFINT